jgi:streptogramin lyase
MTTGADGNIWVPEFDTDKIARVTPGGGVTEFPVLTASAAPYFITSGPDGNLWFTENNVNNIGRITPTGSLTEFPLPPPLVTAPPDAQGNALSGIATGPDGNLWFVHAGANVIGVMSPAGVLVATYPIPTSTSDADFIIKGPDGNMWFNEQVGNKIGRLTVASGHFDEFPIPTPNSASRNLIIGPDNNIWFPELNGGKVARITMSGVITEFLMVADPTIHRLRRIAVTPDGRMWVSSAMTAPPWDSEIGTFDTTGQETDLWSFPLGAPRAITAGPDGQVWFADEATENVVRL